MFQAPALVLCLLLFNTSIAFPRSQDNLPPVLKAELDSLTEPTFDLTRCWQIAQPIILQRDAVRFTLDSGVIAFFQPVRGRITGAMFSGRAGCDVSPPTSLERQQFARFSGDSSGHWIVEELYFRFTDSTFEELFPKLAAPTDVESRFGRRPPGAYEAQIEDELFYSLGSRLLMDLDNGSADGMFYAAIDPEGDTRYHFLIDPLLDEAVRLYRRPFAPEKHSIDLACSWPRARDVAEAHGVAADICRDQIVSRHYRLHTVINEPSQTAVAAQLDFVPRGRGLRAVRFDLASDLNIDSIASDRGPVYFFYDNPELPRNWASPFPMAGKGGNWGTVDVFWTDTLAADSVTSLSFFYRGKYLLYQFPWGDFYINETTSWYPTHDRQTRTTYDMSFEFSATRDIIAVGRKLEERVAGDRKFSSWRMEYPVHAVAFNYGYFEQLEMPPEEDLPRVEIYRGKNHLGSLFAKDMKKKAGNDIIGALRLFTEAYGPLPFDHLAATEIPGGHGQGFPQLLHLAWYSFQEEREGKTELFRAHEVAHQWWGHLVGWKTYHDQWLSEGFAEFSGAWFVERKYGFGKQVREIVTEWKDEILHGGLGGWHKGPQVAPIWMGGRAGSYDSPGSYLALIYNKGAYVLYMLRMMLYDFKTGSDQRFIDLMRDFVQRYRDRAAATEDFQKVVEDHLRGSMSWFFNQWVYGTEIPRLTYTSKISETGDGRFVVSGRIEQSEVTTLFRLFMPITFDFGDKRKSTFLHEIRDRVTEFTSPPLPEKPRNVIFNDYQAILCRE